MTGHKTRVTTHTVKDGKVIKKKPRAVSAQVAIAKSKKKRFVSAK